MDEKEFDEWYPQAKVYFDGSHYIAIPHTVNLSRRRKTHHEEIEVRQTGDKFELVKKPRIELEEINEISPWDGEQTTVEEVVERRENEAQNSNGAVICGNQPIKRKVTRKQIFEELYQKYLDLKKSDKLAAIYRDMRPLFKTDVGAGSFVNSNYERKCRNLTARRVRFARKAFNQNFNYFVTFTYDDKKHIEESFRERLKNVLKNFHNRKGWKYMGVWERGKKTNRLHFHGLFYIPEGMLSGKFEVIDSYDFKKKERRQIKQNTFFADRFGRNEFEELDRGPLFGHALAYIMKYMEKTNEKIVYSRGLYQYFISDIQNEDVLVRTGQEGKKLVLADDFKCWDEGVYVGRVSEQTIKELKKCT